MLLRGEQDVRWRDIVLLVVVHLQVSCCLPPLFCRCVDGHHATCQDVCQFPQTPVAEQIESSSQNCQLPAISPAGIQVGLQDQLKISQQFRSLAWLSCGQVILVHDAIGGQPLYGAVLQHPEDRPRLLQ